jgi:phospholipid/cholesterol/gamma-HCH transport system substrate-binding protein
METRAGYVAVGSAVVLLFVAAMGFVLWMAKYDSDATFKRYWVYFKGSVAGLKTGSSVTYRGISVGEVIDLRIDPDNVEKVRATIEVLGTTPVKSSTVASLELQGLTGGALIMLAGGMNDDPPLQRQGKAQYPVIEATPSQLEKLFEGAPALVDQVKAVVAQVSMVLNTQNRKAIEEILRNTASLSADAAASGPALRELVTNANAAVAKVDKLIAETGPDLEASLRSASHAMQSADVALSGADQAFKDLTKTAADIGSVAKTINLMLDENRRPLRDFTHVTLYDVNAFIAELRELTVTMRRVANELGRDPAGFIFGNQQKGYEAR